MLRCSKMKITRIIIKQYIVAFSNKTTINIRSKVDLNLENLF